MWWHVRRDYVSDVITHIYAWDYAACPAVVHSQSFPKWRSVLSVANSATSLDMATVQSTRLFYQTMTVLKSYDCYRALTVGRPRHELKQHMTQLRPCVVRRSNVRRARRPALTACAGADLQDITCKAAIAWEAEKPLEVVDITVSPPQVRAHVQQNSACISSFSRYSTDAYPCMFMTANRFTPSSSRLSSLPN
jgi:hypothetical protein